MKTTTPYPKIRWVQPQPGKKLLVEFQNGVQKVYDCKPLLQNETFYSLRDETLFRWAHADPQGYGVIWNDQNDLAESEVWIHGRSTELPAALDEA